MGSVYRALDQVLYRVVAIKERIPDHNAFPQHLAQARLQFQREAQILGVLSHANLPHIYDFFTENGNEYVVMELISGENLEEAVRQHGAINEGAVYAWTMQVLDALIFIHNQNIIHRDIKPANLLLKPDGKVLLVDFGLVKLVDPNNPRTITALRTVGTAEYAPLEQFSVGMHTDARSDIYSLGATLYHLLTGRVPLDVPSRLINPSQLASPRSVKFAISPAMEQVVLRAMEIRPQDRFQSAVEMREALKASTGTRLPPSTVPATYETPTPAPGAKYVRASVQTNAELSEMIEQALRDSRQARPADPQAGSKSSPSGGESEILEQLHNLLGG